MAKIILMADGAVLQEMTLSKERITIGRRSSNDIVIDNPAISGQHAAITTRMGESFLEDLGSTNGTLINGQSVKKHFLQKDDVIELAKYRIKYVAAPQREKDAAASSGADQPIPQDGAVQQASITIISGAGSGRELQLTKALTTIGRPGIQVVAISRSPQGFAITLIEGERRPIVNGQAIGTQAHALQDGDVLDLAGTEMQFSLK